MRILSWLILAVILLVASTAAADGEREFSTVRVQIGCNPCRRGCSAATCMGLIHPEMVLRASRALLAGGR